MNCFPASKDTPQVIVAPRPNRPKPRNAHAVGFLVSQATNPSQAIQDGWWRPRHSGAELPQGPRHVTTCMAKPPIIQNRPQMVVLRHPRGTRDHLGDKLRVVLVKLVSCHTKPLSLVVHGETLAAHFPASKFPFNLPRMPCPKCLEIDRVLGDKKQNQPENPTTTKPTITPRTQNNNTNNFAENLEICCAIS